MTNGQRTEADQLLVAARRMTRALKEKPGSVGPDEVLELVRGLKRAKRRQRAFKLSQAAVAAHPKHAPLLVETATGLSRRKRHAEAAEHLRRAIATAGYERVLVRRLAKELTAAGASPAKVDRLYRRAIRRGASDAHLVDEWMALLAQRGVDAPRRVLLDIQRRSRRPVPAVLHHLLADDDLTAEERRPLAKPLERYLKGGAARACATVWDAYCRLEPLDEAACATVRELPEVDVQLFLLSRTPRLVSLDEGLDPALGLDAMAVRSLRDELLRPDPPKSHRDRVFASDRARDYHEIRDRGLAYQTRAVRDRGLRLRDPHTGATVVPFDSVTPSGRTVYSFGDRELSMLVTGGGGNVALALLLPRQQLLLDLDAHLARLLNARRLALLFARLLVRAAKMPERYAEAVAARHEVDRERSVVLLLANTENFAHHLWNFYPGFERIIDHGLAGEVDEVRHGGSEFFGSPSLLFPELGGARFVREERAGFRDPYPFSPGHVLVQPGGYFIRETLVDRLRTAVRAMPPTGHAEPPPPGKRPFPVVWIGLRVGSRSWVDQEHEVPRLTEAILERHPDALFVLDGYSYPVGADLISPKWRKSIDQLHELAASIVKESARPDRLVDLVGNTMRESLLWAEATDVYVAPNGTTQHKIGWVSSAPGISYGPPSLAASATEEMRPGALESEGRPIPVTAIGVPASQGLRRHNQDIRPHLDNIRLDRDEILAGLLHLIDRRDVRHP